MFDPFMQISPYEFMAVLGVGFLAGFLFLPRLVRNPIFGTWLAGVAFGWLRYVAAPSEQQNQQQVVVAIILWTVMILATYIGRSVVLRVYDAPEMVTGFLLDEEILESPNVRAAIIALDEAYRELKESKEADD